MTRLINPCANERQPLRIKIQILLGEIQRLRKQVHQLELERDILTKANELIKNMGISFLKLKNGEKTLIVDALKKKYPVAQLLSVLQLARSCYFYHKASKRLYDEYCGNTRDHGRYL